MTEFERQGRALGFDRIAGVDEAGRGPLAGPVAAAAVILPPGYENGDIRDSKKLSPAKREKLYHRILLDALSVKIAFVEPSVIDAVNILQATVLAMRKAVQGLSPPPDFVLVDGSTAINLDIPQKTIIKGDSRSVSIAAASIIAKVSRDHLMDRYHVQYPQYNFRSNRGYGTREHREAIGKHGICKIHRKSFNIKIEQPS
ncbi:MAG: ribonuclease HII [Syntrophales bacterium]|jgi:ribonuclease HII|nr:ribonuclease HII [Syntrophales bacterium]MCK9528881.1 ribonuclease HII [Syntrophales bacterium]MDX9922955.1 ribonuclease HII [Syntrophales bacterium]